MKILCLCLLSSLSQVLSKQWIDPHDMNTNSKRYLKKSSSAGDLVYENEGCNINIEESSSLIYLKRVINLLLNKVNIDKLGSSEYRAHLNFNINKEDIIFLKGFSSIENVKIDDLRKLDSILSESLEISYLDTFSDMFLNAQEKLYGLVFSQNCLPLLGLSVFIYIAYNLFKSNFSTWYIFRYFVFMVIIIDFMQRYQQLFQEAEEHNMHLKYSLKCDTTKMNWGEYFKFLTSNEDCEKKVVSLLEVGLNQIRSVIIIPLAAAGTGMGQFGSGLWKNLPFPWNILIFPIMLIFCTILTVIVLTTLNNTPFKFNIMHLFHLELGEKKQAITGKTLDKLLDAVSHRPMLQEVKSTADKNIATKVKERSKPKAKSVENLEKVTKKNKTFQVKEAQNNSIQQGDSAQKSESEKNNTNAGNSS